MEEITETSGLDLMYFPLEQDALDKFLRGLYALPDNLAEQHTIPDNRKANRLIVRTVTARGLPIIALQHIDYLLVLTL